MPTFGSLFAGIGGIDLGLERAGWTCRWQVEWDEWCQRVLARHWPDVPRYGDITAVDWSRVEPVDLLAGGFPCQPVSVAGKQRAQLDDRWLWPEFARAVRDLRPPLVLVENVPGLLAHGLGDVLGDLAVSGYDTRVFSLSAAEIGAPHLRKRLFVVADAVGGQLWNEPGRLRRQGRAGLEPERQVSAIAGDDGSEEPLADADGRGRGTAGRSGDGTAVGGGRVDPLPAPATADESPLADADGTGSRGHGRLDRQRDGAGEWTARPGGWPVNGQWLVEPDVGRVAHGVPSRVDRLRGLGNAVVPQVAEVIGRRLMERAA